MRPTAATAAQVVARTAFEPWLGVGGVAAMTVELPGAVVMVAVETGILVVIADPHESIPACMAAWPILPRWRGP